MLNWCQSLRVYQWEMCWRPITRWWHGDKRQNLGAGQQHICYRKNIYQDPVKHLTIISGLHNLIMHSQPATNHVVLSLCLHSLLIQGTSHAGCERERIPTQQQPQASLTYSYLSQDFHAETKIISVRLTAGHKRIDRFFGGTLSMLTQLHSQQHFDRNGIHYEHDAI